MSQFGEYYCEGCRLLQKHLNGSNSSGKPLEQKDFAATAGLTPTFINHLLWGRKRPSVDTAVAIEKASSGSIPVSAWTEQKNPPKQRA